jgi:cytochrome c-type biogenesis protein CcmF
MFVLNNVIFVLLALAIFWGSFGAPILSELLADTEITLGTAYFMQVTPPLFLAMYVLMGVAPVTAWGATSIARLGRALLIPLIGMLGVTAFLILTGTTQPAALIGYSAVSLAGFVAVYEIFRGTSARMRARHESALQAAIALFMRSRRRYGGYIVHLGIAIIGIGVIGSTVFQEQRERTLDVGEVMPVAYGYEMRFDGYRSGLFADDGRVMDIAEVTVIRAGRELGTLRPRIDRFPDGMNMTIAGARSTLENDFYVLLWPTGDTTGITFRVYVNPLVNLIWWGGLVLIAGTIISAWPNEAAAVRVRERAAIGAQMRATS